MVLAVGIDLVDVSRIARMMRHPSFIKRILTPREIDTCTTVTRLAGRWAAKEAVAKAIGIHLRWHQVEIFGDENGRPIVTVDDPHFDPSKHRIHLSITHERSHAAAVAVLEEC